MKLIKLNIERMQTRQALHQYLAESLGFPDYYGANLDALFDCLTDIQQETLVEMPLEIASETSGLGDYGLTLCKVFEQAAKQNDHLRFSVVL